MTAQTSSAPVPHPHPANAPTLDLAAVKARQQATWASGDFAVVGTTLQIVGEQLCEAVDLLFPRGADPSAIAHLADALRALPGLQSVEVRR